MSSEINRVRYVEEIDPNMIYHGKSNDVNVYLANEGWILLNTGNHVGTGDSGSFNNVYYAVGWIGDGDPKHPSA